MVSFAIISHSEVSLSYPCPMQVFSTKSLKVAPTYPSTPSQTLIFLFLTPHIIPTLPRLYKSSRNHRQRIKHTRNKKWHRHPHTFWSQRSRKNIQHERITNSMTKALEDRYCSVNGCPWWFGDPVGDEGEGWDAGAEAGCEDGYSLSWVSICISWEGLNWERKKSVGTYQ